MTRLDVARALRASPEIAAILRAALDAARRGEPPDWSGLADAVYALPKPTLILDMYCVFDGRPRFGVFVRGWHLGGRATLGSAHWFDIEALLAQEDA